MFSKESAPKSIIKNIVTLDAYKDKNYLFKDDIYKPLKKIAFNTSNLLVSYVSNKDIISMSVGLSRSIADEDIADILDIKAYEELGLDQANSYNISSLEMEDDGEGDERLYHIVVAESEELDKLYLPIKQESKYIDLIVPAPLLYKSLYVKEILEDKKVHCFVYFTEDDAFVTIYKNGEYLYSKSIEYSLEQIYDKYCELLGEKVDEKEFFLILESEGMRTTDEDYQENFQKIFSEVFITINDIIIYVKRAFDLDTIHQMFIGTVRGPILGIDEYSQNYLGLESSEFNFNYNLTTDEWYIDQMHYLMLLSGLIYLDDEEAFVNLSTYPRAPSFVNRTSGQFIISTFAAISLSLAYPLYYLVGAYVNDAKIYALNLENKELNIESSKYKKILSEKKLIIKGLDEKVKLLSGQYEGKTKTLQAIYDKKVNYRLKSGMFHKLSEELAQFEVHVEELKSEDDTIWISLVSSDDRKFTEVIKFISDTRFEEIVDISIKEIRKDPISKYYKGLLKVELK